MARLPFFDLNNIPGSLGETLRARPPLNLYRMLPNAPEVAEGFLALGGAILRQSSLTPALRELVILRVGALCEAHYEIHQHRRVARGAGVPDAKIEAALTDPANAVFDERERAVLAFTDAVVRQVKAPQPLYEALAAHCTSQEQMEVIVTIGFYMLVSRLLENTELEVEGDGAAPIEIERQAVAPAPASVDPLRQLFAPAMGKAKPSGRLAGRRVLIVGGGQRRTVDEQPPVGNGRAMTVLFAREGASIACADMDLASAEESVAKARSEGGTAVALQADVSRPEEITRLVREAAQALGGLDGLVLNVGIGNDSRFGTETAEAWDAVMDVNLRAHMLCAQEAAKVMDEGGSIVFVSSTASISPLTGIPAYECSKAALAALCRSTAYATHARGLRANVIAPGLIDTPLGRDASRNRPARSARPLPFGRQGTGWEVAHAAQFLLSSEASYVNGQVLIADGGLSISTVRQPAAA
ncbi:SDR family oxidoreductase [Variovorax sp. Sphag1AA]|uniref:SDR family oxidoreductase n=1 Tax=Variovorax sp. Sphag1AA TaxID=2587027 RepID=UPI0017FA3872|nr:SDR family oxidoreductase [Variovorax sp. Sphag1AA]MBB3182037.1 NAD(P)-dependent dehydrogenase (short-subunit alcohol dehydrogenase family)/alkylhydroperoxidase family enzyme [Variovorax sp. Sphag1AA]